MKRRSFLKTLGLIAGSVWLLQLEAIAIPPPRVLRRNETITGEMLTNQTLVNCKIIDSKLGENNLVYSSVIKQTDCNPILIGRDCKFFTCSFIGSTRDSSMHWNFK